MKEGEKDECECMNCGKTYYNTPEKESWLFCHRCHESWWSSGCPIED